MIFKRTEGITHIHNASSQATGDIGMANPAPKPEDLLRPEGMLTRKEAAVIFGLCERTVMRLAKNHVLKNVQAVQGRDKRTRVFVDPQELLTISEQL